jgi:hypothetical protein
VLIENQTGDVDDVAVAFNDMGDAIVIWEEWNNFGNDMYGRYMKSGVWGPVTLLESMGGWAMTTDVALDNEGNGMAVWAQQFGTRQIFACPCTNGMWGSPTRIDGVVGSSVRPSVAIDGNGDTLVVWRQGVGAYNDSIYANRFSSGQWDGPVLIENLPFHAENIQLASNGGTTLAVWSQMDGGYYNVYACRFSNTWEQPVLLEGPPSDAYNPSISIGDNGDAVVAWQQNDGTYYRIFACVYSASEWGEPTKLVTSNGDASTPCITYNGEQAVCVWQQYDGTRYNVCSNSYSNGTWGSAVSIESSDNEASYPDVAMSDAGDTIAIWTQSGGEWCNRFVNEEWQGPTLIDDTISPDHAQIVMDRDGNAMTVIVGSTSYNQGKSIYCCLTLADLRLTLAPIEKEVSSPSILISGVTSPRANLIINGYDVHVEANGSFSALIPLTSGNNTITATATDSVYGSSATASIFVTYNDQFPSFKQSTESNGSLYMLLGIVGIVLAAMAIALIFMRTKK